MDDYISRKGTVEALCAMECGDDSEYCVKRTCEIFTTLMRLPAAPVREVVLCKDCVRGQYDAVFQQRWCMGELVKEDHFCKYGERKDE